MCPVRFVTYLSGQAVRDTAGQAELEALRAKRKEGVLEVKSLWLEPKVKVSTARADRLNAELTRQARLGGVNSVVWLEDAHKY